jgi:hypothetical protein
MIELEFAFGYKIIIDDEDEDLLQDKWYLAQGYATRCRRKKDGEGPDKIFLHKVIMERKLGHPVRKGMLVDHKNHKRWDCTRDNLRILTKMENVRHG